MGTYRKTGKVETGVDVKMEYGNPGGCIPISIQMGPGVGTYRKAGKVKAGVDVKMGCGNPGSGIPISIQMGPGMGTYRKTGKVNTAREARREKVGCFTLEI